MTQRSRLFMAMMGVALATPMLAQAADKNGIVLYGKARASVDQVDSGGDDNEVTRVSSNSSRLGVKGREDLGNGLNAIFQFETSVNLDDGNGGNTTSGSLFGNGRNSFAGLESENYGTVFFGLYDTPYRVAAEPVEVFHDTLGDNRAIIGNVSDTNTSAEYYVRQRNSLQYWSPKFNNFQIKAFYAPDENATLLTDRYGVNGSYSNGPYYAAIAYERHENELLQTFNTDPPTTTRHGTEGLKVGLGYTFQETTKLGFIYEHLAEDDIAGPFDRNAYYLSVSHQLLGLANKLGLNTVNFAYGHADDNDLQNNSGADFYTIGLSHQLSKRADLYALYATTLNDDNASYGLGAGGTSAATAASAQGENVEGYSFGINYTF